MFPKDLSRVRIDRAVVVRESPKWHFEETNGEFILPPLRQWERLTLPNSALLNAAGGRLSVGLSFGALFDTRRLPQAGNWRRTFGIIGTGKFIYIKKKQLTMFYENSVKNFSVACLYYAPSNLTNNWSDNHWFRCWGRLCDNGKRKNELMPNYK